VKEKIWQSYTAGSLSFPISKKESKLIEESTKFSGTEKPKKILVSSTKRLFTAKIPFYPSSQKVSF
jgi:hypothetical protein